MVTEGRAAVLVRKAAGSSVVVRDVIVELMPKGFWTVEVPWGGILRPRGWSVPVTMLWDSADPYAVTFEFRAERRGWIQWTFSRSLLALALVGPEPIRGPVPPVGDGDVRLELRGDDDLIVTLDSPTGHARFLFYPDPVAEFLLDTYRIVPIGTEQLHVDWNAELARILDRGGTR